jgi:hypothetical protein
MQFEGLSVFDVAAAGKIDPQTGINTAQIEVNAAGILDISTNRIRILVNTEQIIDDQETVAEIYAQPTSEGTFSQQQWNPLANDVDSLLYPEGMGQELLENGKVKSYGFSTKPSIIQLLKSTGTSAGYNGIEFLYNSNRSVQVEMQTRVFISSTQVINRATIWCRLLYINSSGTVIGETSLFKQRNSNGTTAIVTVTNSNFQVDLKLAPAGTVKVRVIPYINVRCDTAPSVIQTNLLADLGDNNRTRLRVSIRKIN